MASSFPLACIFTSTPSFQKHPNKLLFPNPSKLSNSTTTLLSLPSPCKPFSHATSSRSSKLTTSIKASATSDDDVETQKLTVEQWKIERERLSQQIESLELKVQQLTTESSSSKPSVADILKDFYTLGLKIFENKYKEDFTPTPTITKAMMNISSKLQHFASSEDGLVIIDLHPNIPGPNSKLIDELVQNVFKLYGNRTDLTYLKGNFAPVGETPPTTILVEEGKIPETLNGMMLRNGPNPKFAPEGSYMWMDGDSMIHGIRFKNGEAATYVARFTKTSRYLQQDVFKRSEVLMYGDLWGEYGVFASFVDALRTRLKILDKSFGGITTANTGLIYHGRRIMALEDFGQPHVIYVTEEGDLETIGINNYKGKLDHWLSPHPRKDPATGEMFTFGSMRTPPYCIYRKVSKDGDMSDAVNIDVPYPTYMHELCITEHYVIFQLLPVLYDPEKMKSSDEEFVFSYDEMKTPRYGILPRDAPSEEGIQWFDFVDSSFFVFHNANAWEEDKDTIVLYCCNMEAQKDQNTSRPYIAPPNFRRYDDELPSTNPRLFKMTFNLKTNKATKKKISDIVGDYPKINERYLGRKTQYVYSSELNKDNKITSIVKYDLKYDLEQEHGKPTRFVFGTDIYGSEVVFVPKTDSSTGEDDGYLITFVHNEDPNGKLGNLGTSYVYVLDAKTMEFVAKLRLPERVPYGFHAIYVTEKQLQEQIKSTL